MDKSISDKTKAEINTLNQRILEGLQKHDAAAIRAVGSAQFLAKTRDMQEQLKNLDWKVDPAQFRIKNQYYVKSELDTGRFSVMSGVSGDHDYQITFTLLNKESFVSVGYFPEDLETICLTMVYGKVNDDWKLHSLEAGMLKFGDKDAFDWYTEARANYLKGNWVDAALNNSLAARCSKPASNLWSYQKEKDMRTFGLRIDSTVKTNYVFPITLDAVQSKPQVFKIVPKGFAKSYYPGISYVTKLSMKDTVALSKECDEIQQSIGKTFKGLNENKAYVFYRAFAKIPDGQTVIENYGFVRKPRILQ